MAASKSAGGRTSAPAAAPTAKIKSEESTPTKQEGSQAGPLSPAAAAAASAGASKPRRGFAMPLLLLVVFAAGCVAGGHAVGKILEAEYRECFASRDLPICPCIIHQYNYNTSPS